MFFKQAGNYIGLHSTVIPLVSVNDGRFTQGENENRKVFTADRPKSEAGKRL